MRLFSSLQLCAGVLLTSSVFLFGAALPAAGQDLNVYMTASSEVVGPVDPDAFAGDISTYTVFVSNIGESEATGVSVEIQFPSLEFPDGIIFGFDPPSDFEGCGSSCDAGEVATWTVGTLAPGESRNVSYSFGFGLLSTSATLPSSATASADNATDVSASVDIVTDPTPLLRLSVAPGSGPATTSELFTYTLTFGNAGSFSPTGVVLRMPLPEGTSFVSATGGGMESGGVVTWNVGTFIIGAGDQVQLTVEVEDGLPDGSALLARAEIDAGVSTEPVVASSVVTRVQNTEPPLRVEYAVSQTVVELGGNFNFNLKGNLTYTLVAANSGTEELTNVSAQVDLAPDYARPSGEALSPGFSCSGILERKCDWTVNTLDPGESRTLILNVSASAPPGEVVRSTLKAHSAEVEEVTAAQDLHVDGTPLLQLSVAPSPGPATPGEPFTYTLTFGNTGETTPTGVVLRMPLPDGTHFLSASDGGTESNGIVTWSLGTLRAGTGGQVLLTVEVDAGLPDGVLLTARGEIDADDVLESVVRSSAVTAVRSESPLRVAYAANQTAFEFRSVSMPGREISYTLTVANEGDVDLTDVLVRYLEPEGIEPFYGGSGWTHDHDVGLTWSIDRLAPGESRTTFVRTPVFTADAEGRLMRSKLVAVTTNAGEATAAQDVRISETEPLRLSLAPDPGPATSDDSLTYTLTVGNASSTTLTDIVLRMPLPEEVRFVSATDGGTESGGVVTWDIGTLEAGASGQARLTVDLNTGLSDGSLLTAVAEVEAGDVAGTAVRSLAVTPVRSEVPLSATYTVNQTTAQPDDALTYTFTATNGRATDLTDVAVRVNLPDGASLVGSSDLVCPFPPPDCLIGSGCSNVGNTCFWTVQVLPPGEERSTSFSVEVSGNAPRGSLLRGFSLATATGSNEILLQRDVLIANQDTPLPVELASLTGAASDESVVLKWTTAAETNNAGFDIERSTDGTAFTRVGHEAGRGTTTEAQTYRFVDADVPFADTLHYRLRQIDLDGTTELSPVVTVGLAPQRVALLPNAPNPFSVSTRLRYTLTEEGPVSLQVYDLLGRRVATLVDREQPAGRYAVTLDGARLPSGTYFVRLRAGTQVQSQRIAVVR